MLWKFLFGVYLILPFLSLCRVKKLKETLVAMQQLDKNMSSLRSWLAHIESELSKPIVYETCDSEEIQRKLNEQQVKYNTITRWHGESQSRVALGCPYPVHLRGHEAKCLNIKASGTYCVTYTAFCWPWHRIHQELIDISKKGKALRDITWMSYCSCFPLGLVVFVCLNCLFPEAKLTLIWPCKFCRCLKITIFSNLSNSVLFCSLFESHFAREDAWAIHVKLKILQFLLYAVLD